MNENNPADSIDHERHAEIKLVGKLTQTHYTHFEAG